ncbi:MAG: hypothetical protein J2P23_05995 [Microlunatus sp.]|nr:hypothetical protein [Microlunatus sp.]
MAEIVVRRTPWVAASRVAARRVAAPLVTAVVFCTAVAARIVPLLRGGGLQGYGPYDDSVYFASSVGWLHGRWPYRDFLVLQPPGIVVALAPYAFLDRWIGDAGGLAVARVGWILFGGLTAAGLVALLWRTSRSAALVAGLFYAVSWPAAMVERVTDLEGPQNFLLVVALLLLRPFGPERASLRSRRTAALAAGIALGLAWSVKIWELAPIVVLAGWLAVRSGRREVGWFSGGALGAVSAVCLPFFVVAPRQMFRMVVLDQLNRPWHAGWAKRLVDITGTTHVLPPHRFSLGLIIVLLAMAIALALAAGRPGGRVIVMLYLAQLAVLLQSPPIYVHYGAFVAPAMAIVIGVAVSEVIQLLRGAGSVAVVRVGQSLVAITVAAVLVDMAHAPATLTIGYPAPTGRLDALTDTVHGCISYDEPSQALALNVVSQDLARGCPFVVDLGAASHWTHLKHEVNGRPSQAEMVALHYLRGAKASLLYRYRIGHSAAHAVNIIGGWSLLAENGGLRLVKPHAH